VDLRRRRVARDDGQPPRRPPRRRPPARARVAPPLDAREPVTDRQKNGGPPAAAPGALLMWEAPAAAPGALPWSGGAPVGRLRKSLGLRPTRMFRLFASGAPPALDPGVWPWCKVRSL